MIIEIVSYIKQIIAYSATTSDTVDSENYFLFYRVLGQLYM
jgi:hypothetical protein